MGSLPGLDRGGVRGRGSAVVYKRDPRSTTPWGLLISAALPSRSLAIRLRDGAARLFPDPLATRLSRNTAHGKKESMNTGYWIVALLLLLSLQSYWRRRKPSSRCPTASSRRRWPRARGRSAGVGSYGDRAPEVAGSRGKTTIVATRVEPDLADRRRSTTCPMPACWRAPGCAMCVVDPASGSLLWRLVLPVPPLAEKQGMGGFLNIGKSRAKVSWKRTPV